MRPRPSLGRRLARLLKQHPIGAIGAFLIVFVVAVALGAKSISPYDPAAQPAKRLQPPSAQYLLGTDQIGRDLLSRIIYGSRVSLYVGVVAVGLAVVIGIPIGLSAGFVGGTYDSTVMRLIDIVLAFPALVLAIAITGMLGPSVTNCMIAIGIVYSPQFARVSRASVLTIKNEMYIEAAVLVGCRTRRLILRHILPNMLAPLIVLITLQMSTAILTEAGLSFLGLGTQPPTPSWGLMLSGGRNVMEIVPGMAIFPGLAIAITVLAFNFLGDGLRDALDPRLRQL
jgi:peptide/nickel transport system permease protein